MKESKILCSFARRYLDPVFRSASPKINFVLQTNSFLWKKLVSHWNQNTRSRYSDFDWLYPWNFTLCVARFLLIKQNFGFLRKRFGLAKLKYLFLILWRFSFFRSRNAAVLHASFQFNHLNQHQIYKENGIYSIDIIRSILLTHKIKHFYSQISEFDRLSSYRCHIVNNNMMNFILV